MSTIRRRAVRDEQKLERRQALITQAWALFQTTAYEAINIFDVAQGLKLAKGTVYLYFKTKEELFLAVLIDQFTAWFADVDAGLATAPDTIDGVVTILSAALARRPALVRLFAITHVILEHNIDHEAARGFKQFLSERVGQTGVLLEARLTWLRPGEGAALLLRAYALVIGVQHVADPAPVVREVLEATPEFAPFLVDFQPEFRALLTALLHGLASLQSAAPPPSDEP